MATENVIKMKGTKKVKFCDKTLWKNYLSVIAWVSTIVSLVSFFFTADDMEINKQCLGILFILGMIIVFWVMWRWANSREHADLRINNTTVKVVVGDIWELFEKKPEDRKGEISVIGVNDFYDLIVDDRIIATSSLHGQYIDKINQAGKLDELNDVIENDIILNKAGNSKPVPSRKIGRKIRYEIGSVVEFEAYVLTAFTKFDSHNEAWLSAKEYTDFWMSFWKNLDQIYAGRTINIPLMGAGITRFRDGKPSKQELLEVMLWTMKISGFHNTYADKRINFVIYPSEAAEIDFYRIQNNPNFR